MNEQLLDTIKELEIKKAPEEQSLEAANQSYTKKQLAHFIERYDLDIAKSWKKDDIVAPPSDWMKEASADLLDSDSALRSFYEQEVLTADNSFDTYSTDLSEEKLERVLRLIEHGLVYNVEGQLWAREESAETVKSVAGSDDQSSSTKEPVREDKEDAVKPQPKPRMKQPVRKPSPSLSTEEKLAQEKQARLNYLKKLAKKKKKKR